VLLRRGASEATGLAYRGGREHAADVIEGEQPMLVAAAGMRVASREALALAIAALGAAPLLVTWSLGLLP
jgi:hypothetical protein